MLSDIASTVTLILFVIYFIGRIITIIIEKNIQYERIDIYKDKEDIPKDLKIIDEYECKNANDILIITPKNKAYNWLKIHECKYDEENRKLKKTNECYEFKKICNDMSIKIETTITCGIPQYILEFERSDFMKGNLPLQFNGKNGIEEELIEVKHTWKSIIYYLFR